MLILNLICCLIMAATVFAQSNPEVQSKDGKIRGFTTTHDSTTITKFLGIPFAKPPTGTRRFMKPEKMNAWSNILDAKKYSPSCYQSKALSFDLLGSNVTESEDCLYLNVFIPGTLSSAQSSPKAVMVWIYGGGYITGNANTYPGDSLALSQDVIVVNLNYRLSLFGFMASDDGTIPGNQAMFDQHAALTWVKENIAAFGGDASKITIFGVSAGANSVFNHLMSPLSRNLFTRAIILSTAKMTVVSKENQYAMVRRIVAPVCKKATAQELVKCLQGLSPEKIVELGDIAAFGYAYVTVDGEFFTENPYKVLAEGKFDISKEVIIGFMADDGDLMLQVSYRDWNGFLKNGVDIRKAKELASLGLSNYFKSADMPNKVIMENLVYQMYLSCQENPLKLARGIIDEMTDAFFAVPTFQIAHAIAKYGGKVYLYEFDHLSGYLRAKLQPNVRKSSGHTEELAYVFGYLSVLGQMVTPAETKLSASIMKAFTEFAKSGQPVYLTSANQNAQWKAFTGTGMNYIRFTTNMTQNSVKPVPEHLQRRIQFWLSVMEGIQMMETCHPYTGEPSRPWTSAGVKARNIGLVEMLMITIAVGIASRIYTIV